MIAAVNAPAIDYAGLAPLFAVAGGATLVLLTGLFKHPAAQRTLVPLVALLALVVAGDLTIRLWDDERTLIEGAMRVDNLGVAVDMIFLVAGAATIFFSLGQRCVRESGAGEFHALLLSSIAGMIVLAGAENLVTFFIGLELLSIPLYVLCAGELGRRVSLEAGLKYLIVGSVGSATLLYGLAFIYGATGTTDFGPIGQSLTGNSNLLEDPLLLVGVALAATGLAFKVSVAPFHMWTPDVYQGAPTPVTAFMAVATKAAAFAVFLRFFDQALPALHASWGDALAVLAVVSIAVGNIGAIRQRSMKRLLGYSGIAQAGYMLAGVVVATQLGIRSLVFYLAVYMLMNLGAFAVVAARERETKLGDAIDALDGIGRTRPLLAVVMTVSMLSLAGFPATAGFVGKFYLIQATIEGGFTWLGVAIVVGTMISLVYYLRVVAVMWLVEAGEAEMDRQVESMPAMAGGSPEADRATNKLGAPQFVIPAIIFAAATIFFGIIPEPLVQVAEHAGNVIAGLP